MHRSNNSMYIHCVRTKDIAHFFCIKKCAFFSPHAKQTSIDGKNQMEHKPKILRGEEQRWVMGIKDWVDLMRCICVHVVAIKIPINCFVVCARESI